MRIQITDEGGCQWITLPSGIRFDANCGYVGITADGDFSLVEGYDGGLNPDGDPYAVKPPVWTQEDREALAQHMARRWLEWAGLGQEVLPQIVIETLDLDGARAVLVRTPEGVVPHRLAMAYIERALRAETGRRLPVVAVPCGYDVEVIPGEPGNYTVVLGGPPVEVEP